jgi:hypothetical protein
MPDKLYTIEFISESKALSALNANLKTTDSLATTATSTVRKFGAASTFSGTSAKGASTAVRGLGRSFGTAATNATKAAGAVGSVGAAAAAATPQLQAAGAAAGGMKANVGALSLSTKGASSAVGMFTARIIALQAARAVLHGVMEATQEIEDRWKKLAQEASDFRDSMRELASLKGEKGPNNTVTADVLDLALQAHMMPDKAGKLSAAYENIGPTVRAKGHYKPAAGQGTPKELEAAIVADAAQTAVRLGIDEKAAGEAIGVAAMNHAFTSKEDAMEQFGGAMKGLSEGKLEYSAGVKALSKGAAVLVDPKEAADEGAKAGRLGSYAEAGVYMGAMSLGTGTADQAQMRMIQVSRLLNPDATNETGTKALAAAGFKDEMTDPQKLIQLSKHLKSKGVDDTQKWLVENDLGTVSTREKTVAALKTADVLEQRLKALKESRKTNATGKATLADNAQFMATDKAGQARAVDAIKAATDLVEGIEGPEVFEKAKQAAEERRRQQDPTAPYDVLNNYVEKDSWMNPFSWMSELGSGVGVRANEQENNSKYGAIPHLKAEAKRVGADISQHLAGLGSSNLKVRADAFTAAAEAVRDKGGDPMGVTGLTDQARARVKASRPPDAAQRPAAVVGAPAPAPVVGAAAGVPHAALDPALLNETKNQTKLLERISRSVAPQGGGAGVVDRGPLSNGAGNVIPVRA